MPSNGRGPDDADVTHEKRPARYLEGAIAIVSLLATAALVVFNFRSDNPQTSLKAIFGILAVLSLASYVSAYYARQRTERVQSIEEKVDSLTRSATLSPTKDELVSQLRTRFDGDLYNLFPQHFDRVIESVLDNVDTKHATLTRVEEFPLFYANTLGKFPGASFCATSFSNDNYLWAHPEVGRAISEFHGRGGRMKRIFFVDRESDGTVGPEVESTLLSQREAGVEVSTVSYATVQGRYPELLKFMLADEQSRIAWTYEMTDRSILKVHVTTDRTEIEKNLRIFRSLRQLNETTAFGTS